MAYLFNGISQIIDVNSTPITNAPLTLFGRGRSVKLTTNQALFSIVRSTKSNGCYMIAVAGLNDGDPVGATAWGSTVTTAISASGILINEWLSVGGVFPEGNNSRSVFNGVEKTTQNANSGQPISLAKMQIGAFTYESSLATNIFNGDLAETAAWSVALSDDEMVSLAKGFKPSRIRPQSLVFYAPLVRAAIDVCRGITLTPVNGPTVAPHPRIY